MFEVNLLSSDDVAAPITTPRKGKEPEVIDLLSSSPAAAPLDTAASPPRFHTRIEPPRTPPKPQHDEFELSSSPIFITEDRTDPKCSATQALINGSEHAARESDIPTPLVEKEMNIPPPKPQINSSVKTQSAKRAFKSNTEVDVSRLKSASKRFKAARSSSAPPAVKLVTDRRKACDGINCTIWESSGDWTTLLNEAFSGAEVQASCSSITDSLYLEGVEAIVTVHGEFSDEWQDDQHVFVRAAPHTEFMDTHIVVLEASYLETLGNKNRESRKTYFDRIHDFIASSGRCNHSFHIAYVVPEVHNQFRKMMAAYDRRLRQRVMAHSNGQEVAVEPPPQQHYFNEIQVRLQVESHIRAVYPRTKAEAAETMVNWVIDMCFSRYRMRTDATLEGVGGTVKSKSSVPEITAEAFAVVHGLPPRIASSIAGDLKSIGKLYSTIRSSSEQQRLARLRYYGKGDWNQSLIALLTCEDPDQTIGQV